MGRGWFDETHTERGVWLLRDLTLSELISGAARILYYIQ